MAILFRIYCWWFRNPANQLKPCKLPIISFIYNLQGWKYMLVGCLGISEPSTVRYFSEFWLFLNTPELDFVPTFPIEQFHPKFQVYGARSTIIDNIASDIRPLEFRAIQVRDFSCVFVCHVKWGGDLGEGDAMFSFFLWTTFVEFFWLSQQFFSRMFLFCRRCLFDLHWGGVVVVVVVVVGLERRPKSKDVSFLVISTLFPNRHDNYSPHVLENMKMKPALLVSIQLIDFFLSASCFFLTLTLPLFCMLQLSFNISS